MSADKPCIGLDADEAIGAILAHPDYELVGGRVELVGGRVELVNSNGEVVDFLGEVAI
jgi:hypothetical protein